MSGFSAQWLALREPYDARARNRDVLFALQSAFGRASSVAVVDLGCGTGATLRAISRYLPACQSWRLVDHDVALLAAATPRLSAAITVATVAIDLAHDLDQALGDGPDLVTMSALLDLVSAEWLDRLVEAVAHRRCPIYAALSYDGEVTMTPATRYDDVVIAAVNRHQLSDKGFGPALGPEAARLTVESFRRNGFVVAAGRSDWSFGAQDRDIQAALLEGWAEAAGATGVAPGCLADWLSERRHHIAAGRSHMRVGHVDVFAVPIGWRWRDRSQSNRTSLPGASASGANSSDPSGPA